MGNIKNVNGVNVEMTTEEIAEIQAVRDNNPIGAQSRRRDTKDWMATSDYTMSDAWKTYRQALRDLPSVSGFPNVDFPTKPS